MVPPYQTSAFGFSRSARICAYASPVGLRVIATAMPVSRVNVCAASSQASGSWLQ